MSEQKRSRERQILDTAALLFRQRGYQGTRMDDLAAETNLNKGTLYHYFPSKAEILYHIYLDTSEEFLEGIRQHPADAPADKLLALVVHDIANAIVERRDHVTVYFQEMQWLEKWLPADQYQEIQARQVEFQAYVTSVIQRGMDSGVFRPLDPTVAAFALIGMVGWTYQWFTPGGRRTIDEVADMFVDLALAAFAPMPETATAKKRR